MASSMASAAGRLAPLTLNASGASNRGLQRALNEDSFLADFPVFIVADGMGGHDAGDRASAAVIDVFRSLVRRDDLRPEEVLPLVAAAQQAVAEIASETTRGAGSTLSGAIAVRHDNGERHWLILNVGDSRVYRAIGDRFEQLTVDHSLAQELIERGELDPSEAHAFAGRNVITRAIGDPESEPDFWLVPMVSGERLLVCSDGLTGELSDETIKVGLTFGGSTEHTATTLINQALEHGGNDNITVVIVDVLEGGIDPGQETPTSGRVAGLPISELDEHTIESVTRPSERNRGRA